MNTITAQVLPANPRPVDRCINTGRVRIGIAHIPTPRPTYEPDAQRLQAALLEPRTQVEPSTWQSIAAAVYRWC